MTEKEFWGLYNMVCGGVTGRLEVAQELLNILDLASEIKITQVTSDYWKDIYFAVRPPSERLIAKKLNLRNINVMRDWRICLKEYVDNYYQGYLN